MALGILALAFLGGYYYRGTFIRMATPKVFIIERPVEIPAKRDSAAAAHIHPAASRVNLQDSLIALAVQNDSLAQFAETLSTPFEVAFEDTITVKDSLGSFYTRRIDSLLIDPLTLIVKRRVTYLDSKLTTVKIEQPIILEESWLDRVLWALERVGWFILGLLAKGAFGG